MSKDGILEEEHEQYARFTNETLEDLLAPRRAGATLFHYTTGPNLISIIRDGALWFTQISCLNDEEELRHGLALVQSEIRDRVSAARGPLKELYAQLEDRANAQQVFLSHTYIVCFSTVLDDLNQWRAYGGDTAGYSLGLSRAGLLQTIAGKRGTFLAPVIYRGTAKIALIRTVLDQIAEFFAADIKKRTATERQKWIPAFSDQWIFTICGIICLFKNPHFSSEREWRLIALQPANPDFMPAFSHKNAMFRRHVVLRFEGKKLPIVRVCIGPSPYPDHGRVGVKQLLRSYGYNVPKININNSEVPLRRVL